MINIGTTTLTCDKSIPPCPILPEQCRYPIFTQFHNLCHSNWKSTSRMILTRVTWPNAQRTIKEWFHNCLTYQQMKITRNIYPTRQLNEAVARFTHVHMDIVGPLPAINNSPFRCLVTFIDRSTNWIEAHPVHSITAEEVCHAFLTSSFSRFGVPLYITTARGTQFESQLFAQLSQTLGFCRLRTTSYHPQSNGNVERFHRTLKAALMSSKTDWIAARTTRSSFRIEVKTGHQSHFTVSSHNRTRCTLPDNSCRKDSTHHSRLHQKHSGQPRTASFHKRYQTTFNTKDLHPRCIRQLQICMVARRPSKATFGSTLHWTS